MGRLSGLKELGELAAQKAAQTGVAQGALNQLKAAKATVSQNLQIRADRKALHAKLLLYVDLHEQRAKTVWFRDAQIAEGLDRGIEDIDHALAPVKRDIKTLIGDDWKAFLEQADLVPITKNSGDDIIAQLHANEAVHPVYSFDDFKAQRIGDDGDDKSTHALVLNVPGKNGEVKPVILAAVFVKHVNLPLLDDGTVAIAEIPGNLQALKQEGPQPLMHEDSTMPGHILYTITNPELARGTARVLADRLLLSFNGKAVVSTLSPMRQLYETIPVEELIQKGDAEIEILALRHLASGANSVFHFHGKTKGAQVLKLNRNNGDPDDPLSVNYMYSADPEVRMRSAEMAQRRALSISEGLVAAASAAGIQFGVAQRDGIQSPRDVDWSRSQSSFVLR